MAMPLINSIRELLKGRENEPTVGDVLGYIKERRASGIPPGPCFLCVDAPAESLSDIRFRTTPRCLRGGT